MIRAMCMLFSPGHRFPSTSNFISRKFGGDLRNAPTTAIGVWQVSSYGRICSPRGAISFGSAHPCGYFRVRMSGSAFLVHRVVAYAFLGPAPMEDAWQVHHKDGNPGNNNITNLEYVTQSQNVSHSFASGSRRCSGPMLSKPVMYRAHGSKDWTRFSSQTSAASALGVSQSAVSRACRHKTPLRGDEFFFADLGERDLPGEEWRQMLCPMFGEEVPGRSVSSLGRLRNKAGHIHFGSLRSGYLAARYMSPSGSQIAYVHRLAAFVFLGPPPSPHHTHVNHKDGDKWNNEVQNLEYVTPAQNRAHYLENRQHEGKSRSHSKPVWSRKYNSSDEWTWHPSILNASNALGLRSGLVSRCIHGRTHYTGGYEFRPAEAFPTLPGEEWREVDVEALAGEKRKRMQAPCRKIA